MNKKKNENVQRYVEECSETREENTSCRTEGGGEYDNSVTESKDMYNTQRTKSKTSNGKRNGRKFEVLFSDKKGHQWKDFIQGDTCITVDGRKGPKLVLQYDSLYYFNIKQLSQNSTGLCDHSFYFTKSPTGGVDHEKIEGSIEPICQGNIVMRFSKDAYPKRFFYQCSLHGYEGGPIEMVDDINYKKNSTSSTRNELQTPKTADYNVRYSDGTLDDKKQGSSMMRRQSLDKKKDDEYIIHHRHQEEFNVAHHNNNNNNRNNQEIKLIDTYEEPTQNIDDTCFQEEFYNNPLCKIPNKNTYIKQMDYIMKEEDSDSFLTNLPNANKHENVYHKNDNEEEDVSSESLDSMPCNN